MRERIRRVRGAVDGRGRARTGVDGRGRAWRKDIQRVREGFVKWIEGGGEGPQHERASRVGCADLVRPRGDPHSKDDGDDDGDEQPDRDEKRTERHAGDEQRDGARRTNKQPRGLLKHRVHLPSIGGRCRRLRSAGDVGS